MSMSALHRSASLFGRRIAVYTPWVGALIWLVGWPFFLFAGGSLLFILGLVIPPLLITLWTRLPAAENRRKVLVTALGASAAASLVVDSVATVVAISQLGYPALDWLVYLWIFSLVLFSSWILLLGLLFRHTLGNSVAWTASVAAASLPILLLVNSVTLALLNGQMNPMGVLAEIPAALLFWLAIPAWFIVLGAQLHTMNLPAETQKGHAPPT
jgi:hypothetical protein